MTDMGASSSQLGASSAGGNPDVSPWANFSSRDLLPGHTVGMVYELLAKSAVVEITDAEDEDIDHYLGDERHDDSERRRSEAFTKAAGRSQRARRAYSEAQS